MSSGELYGKWQLREVYQDPGDGSGRYELAKGDAKYLTFTREGVVSGDAIPGYVRFKILDGQRVALYIDDKTKPIEVGYKVDSHRLTLTPPCIEGCGFKFIRL